MMRRALALLILVLPALACTFGARPQPTPIPPTPTAPLVVIDARDQATNTPAPTTAPAATRAPACTPRTDWQVYVVQAGDTLGSLARRTNSSISALTAANCLADPNRLAAGQQIRVPRAPVAELPPALPQACPPQVAIEDPNNRLMIAPSVASDGYCFVVRPGDWVTVSWPAEALGDFTQITFYRWNDSLPRPDVIGVDTNPMDGAAISYQAQTTMQPSVIYAMAEGPGPHSSRNSSTIGMVLSN